ncbi:hypothetical protein BG57_12425 [Caballeronia grimmiae]|uniref:Uncharacterized protein n=1 Tax=Caballeronia grimmiae TaxID=1071679 RepID=A0A069NTN9_9BURK|nr:hypothetical protein BG57_12425 [Caballeronia grimmiae]
MASVFAGARVRRVGCGFVGVCVCIVVGIRVCVVVSVLVGGREDAGERIDGAERGGFGIERGIASGDALADDRRDNSQPHGGNAEPCDEAIARVAGHEQEEEGCERRE